MIIPKTSRRSLGVVAFHIGLYLLLLNVTGICGMWKKAARGMKKMLLEDRPSSTKVSQEDVESNQWQPHREQPASPAHQSDEESSPTHQIEQSGPRFWSQSGYYDSDYVWNFHAEPGIPEEHNDDRERSVSPPQTNSPAHASWSDGVSHPTHLTEQNSPVSSDPQTSFDHEGNWPWNSWHYPNAGHVETSAWDRESNEGKSDVAHRDSPQRQNTARSSYFETTQKRQLLQKLTSDVPEYIADNAEMKCYPEEHPLHGFMSTQNFVGGEGHCQYLAVACILYHHFANRDDWLEKGLPLRKVVAEYLEKHPEYFEGLGVNQKDYIKKVRGREYGDHLTLIALTEVTGLHIPCVSLTTSPYASFHGHESDEKTIGLLLQGEHYELLFKDANVHN